MNGLGDRGRRTDPDPRDQRQRWFRALSFAGVIILMVGVIAFVGPGALVHSLASARPGWLLAAIAAAIASPGIVALREAQ